MLKYFGESVYTYIHIYIYIYIPSICRSELGSSGTPSRNKKHSANEWVCRIRKAGACIYFIVSSPTPPPPSPCSWNTQHTELLFVRCNVSLYPVRIAAPWNSSAAAIFHGANTSRQFQLFGSRLPIQSPLERILCIEISIEQNFQTIAELSNRSAPSIDNFLCLCLSVSLHLPFFLRHASSKYLPAPNEMHLRFFDTLRMSALARAYTCIYAPSSFLSDFHAFSFRTPFTHDPAFRFFPFYQLVHSLRALLKTFFSPVHVTRKVLSSLAPT